MALCCEDVHESSTVQFMCTKSAVKVKFPGVSILALYRKNYVAKSALFVSYVTLIINQNFYTNNAVCKPFCIDILKILG